jgi:hypothetical protein
MPLDTPFICRHLAAAKCVYGSLRRTMRETAQQLVIAFGTRGIRVKLLRDVSNTFYAANKRRCFSIKISLSIRATTVLHARKLKVFRRRSLVITRVRFPN